MQFYPNHLENSRHLYSNKLIVDKLYILLKIVALNRLILNFI